MDTTQLLISGYLDGELTDEEVRRLSESLESDEESLDQLVWNSFIHSQLLEWMDHESVQDHELAAACAVDDGSDKVSLSTSASRGGAGRAPARLWPIWSAAAALLVAAGISALTYFAAARPVIVAQLTDAAGCRWEGAQTKIPAGTFLHDGQELELVRGNAVITFESGAKVWLEGPTSLRLDSPMEAHLLNGRIAAKVPTQARGFAVTSSLARFVDLGTEFTLSLAAEESFELHVFDGLVELQLDKRFGAAARHPLNVPEVRAYSFDVAAGDVKRIDFQEGKKMPF